MMKVKMHSTGNTYLVHWKTSPFVPKHGSPSREVTQTTCFIRGLLSDGSKVGVSTGTVREHSEDRHNNIVARKLSLEKALKANTNPGFTKRTRSAFWKEYKETARVTPRSKNEKLQKKIKELEKKNEEMEKTFSDSAVECAEAEERARAHMTMD